MSHSYTNSLFHCVFSTKERKKLIDEELQLAIERAMSVMLKAAQ